MYQRTYRQKRVLEVMSSQDSCASTVSSGDSSAASSGLSDRSLRRGASSSANSIKHLGLEGQRKLFQRSDILGVLGRLGFRPPCRAPEEGDVEVEVEGDDTSVGQPPTVPTCCISVMDKFLCSQQISDMSPFKKHQVRKRSWQFLREPVRACCARPFQPPTPCTQDGAVHLLQAHEARSLGQDQQQGNNCNFNGLCMSVSCGLQVAAGGMEQDGFSG